MVVVVHGRKAISAVCLWQLDSQRVDSQRVCAPAHGRIWHCTSFAAAQQNPTLWLHCGHAAGPAGARVRGLMTRCRRNRAAKTTEIPQCSGLFATPSYAILLIEHWRTSRRSWSACNPTSSRQARPRRPLPFSGRRRRSRSSLRRWAIPSPVHHQPCEQLILDRTGRDRPTFPSGNTRSKTDECRHRNYKRG